MGLLGGVPNRPGLSTWQKLGSPSPSSPAPGAQMGEAVTASGTSSPRPHLDWPVERRPPPAQHKQAQDGDAVAEVVDKGHVVDERVRVSHKHDDRRGPALGEDRDEGWPSTCLLSALQAAVQCLPAQARGLASPGPPHSHCGLPIRARVHPRHHLHCRVAQAPRLASLGPPTYADEEGRDRGAVSDVDHGQQAGQVPFSGSREAQPACWGQRWVGAVSPGLGGPTCQIPDLSSRPDVPLEWLPLTPAPGPNNPTGEASLSSSLSPFCFLFLRAGIRHLLLGSSLSQLQAGPTWQDFSSSGLLHCLRAGAPALPHLDHPLSQSSHLEEVNR